MQRRKKRRTMAWALPWLLLGLLLLGTTLLFAADSRSITVDEVMQWQQDGTPFLFVDVRGAHRYEMRHARGAISVPAFAAGDRHLPTTAPIVVYDAGAGAVDGERAAVALAAKGHDVYILAGGLTAWEAQSSPIVGTPGANLDPLFEIVGAEDLQRMIEGSTEVVVFDVRPGVRHISGNIPGARMAPSLEKLFDLVKERPRTDLIVLYDDGEGTSQKYAEALRRKGYRAIKVVYGGMIAWLEKGYRVQR